jgi:hypothetical protein
MHVWIQIPDATALKSDIYPNCETFEYRVLTSISACNWEIMHIPVTFTEGDVMSPSGCAVPYPQHVYMSLLS